MAISAFWQASNGLMGPSFSAALLSGNRRGGSLPCRRDHDCDRRQKSDSDNRTSEFVDCRLEDLLDQMFA
jgi:hypothetical protein